MVVTIDDDARRVLTLFEDVTGVRGVDCLKYDNIGSETGDEGDDTEPTVASEKTDDDGNILIVVSTGNMGEAIGPNGSTVQRFERRVGSSVRLIENAADPERFVANALSPAAVYNVTISENGDTVAYVEVANEDRGVAIGSNGRTIEAARILVSRHFDIDDVQLV